MKRNAGTILGKMDKTEQTLAIIKKKCKQIGHGEWPIKLIVYDGDIVGFDELDRPVIKFRAKKDLTSLDL